MKSLSRVDPHVGRPAANFGAPPDSKFPWFDTRTITLGFSVTYSAGS